jgi:hypothetical protein
LKHSLGDWGKWVGAQFCAHHLTHHWPLDTPLLRHRNGNCVWHIYGKTTGVCLLKIQTLPAAEVLGSLALYRSNTASTN